jgi:hypothetical protein
VTIFLFDSSISRLLKSLFFFFLVLFCFSFLLLEEFEGGFTALTRPDARLARADPWFSLLESVVVPLETPLAP